MSQTVEMNPQNSGHDQVSAVRAAFRLKQFNFTSRENGSVMLLVVLTFAVISMVVGAVVFRTLNNYHSIVQVASWQEAMLGAESGVDAAMAALRTTLSDPTNAWNNWQTTDSSGNPLPNNARIYRPPNLVHDGEGNTELSITVTVDAPPELTDGSGRQWYRIRSTGTTYLPGNAKVVGPDKRDHGLRKLSLVRDRKTGNLVSRPQVSRMIEIIAKPIAVESALVALGRIQLNNYNIIIDSYDSRDPNKSTNGLYDPAKFQQNGDVATDGSIIDAGNAYVYGDVSTNSGTILNNAHITGQQRADFYKDLVPVQKPSWVSIIPNPNNIRTSITLTGGSALNPTRYKVSSVQLSGNDVLTFAPSTPGVESYVELWVTGDVSAQGNSVIDLQPNVHVKIYVEGNLAVNGNGFLNETGKPPNMQIMGVHPSDGSSRTAAITGNGSFIGSLYAPDMDVTLSNGGSKGVYYGGIIAKTITMNDHTSVHYDEALSEAPMVTDYAIASWFEDNQ